MFIRTLNALIYMLNTLMHALMHILVMYYDIRVDVRVDDALYYYKVAMQFACLLNH